MRGKQAAKAANRRDRAEVEQERDEALLAARRAEKALADERAAFEVKRAALERDVAVLREAAEKVVAPALADERIRSEQYRLERDEAIEKMKEIQEKDRKVMDRTNYLIASALNISRFEAAEVLLGFVVDQPEAIVLDTKLVKLVNSGRLTHEQAERIDAGRYGRKRTTSEKVAAAIAEADGA